jgi:hypothetical protein
LDAECTWVRFLIDVVERCFWMGSCKVKIAGSKNS